MKCDIRDIDMIDYVDLEYLINKSYLWNDESRREIITADVSASSPLHIISTWMNGNTRKLSVFDTSVWHRGADCQIAEITPLSPRIISKHPPWSSASSDLYSHY